MGLGGKSEPMLPAALSNPRSHSIGACFSLLAESIEVCWADRAAAVICCLGIAWQWLPSKAYGQCRKGRRHPNVTGVFSLSWSDAVVRIRQDCVSIKISQDLPLRKMSLRCWSWDIQRSQQPQCHCLLSNSQLICSHQRPTWAYQDTKGKKSRLSLIPLIICNLFPGELVPALLLGSWVPCNDLIFVTYWGSACLVPFPLLTLGFSDFW